MRVIKSRLVQLFCLLVCLMLMLVVPIWRNHKLFGYNLPSDEEEKIETLRETDGGIVVNTTEIGKDIVGYGGHTPVEITIKDGKIVSVKALPNQETPEFFGAIRNSDMLESLDGKTLAEALATPIHGVSGASYSSKAIIGNIRAGVEYALKSEDAFVKTEGKASGEKLPLKFYITIVIIVAGGVVPLFVKDKRYRVLQLVLNVLLLGFWGGTFISYSLMTSYLTNGIKQVVLIPTVLMLIAAFIYPLFGRKDYYCLWMCPYGSLQELMGKWVKIKIKIKPGVVKWLNYFREFLWFVLMWLMWTGLWIDWMGYEPFAAFFFKDSSAVVLGIAGGFLILSLFINRPYCRFVCPTGSLFKFAENSAQGVTLSTKHKDNV